MAGEPLFMAIADADPEFQQTVRDAQATLGEFRRRLRSSKSTGAVPCIKTLLVDGEHRAFLWLANVRAKGKGFVASVFEIPKEFSSFGVGDEIEVTQDAIADWMVNEGGVLFGGFSLRYQRSKLADAKRAGFDQHIGVAKYAETEPSPGTRARRRPR